jgi:hypothetical protein
VQKMTVSTSIADGQSLSAAVPFRGLSPKSIHVASGAEGTWLSFRRTDAGATGVCRGWTGEPLTAAFVAGSWLEIDPADLASPDVLAFELCSDEAGTPQPQAGAVVLTIVAIGS